MNGCLDLDSGGAEGWVSGFDGRVGVRIPRIRRPRKGGCPDSASEGGCPDSASDGEGGRREGGCPDSASRGRVGVRIRREGGRREGGCPDSARIPRPDSASGFRAGFDALPDSALRVRRILR